MNKLQISISAVSWAWLLPRRGRSGRRLDFYGKHHASSSKMSAAWWQPYQVESASKTNFYIPQNLVNHKVPLRGTCNVQLMDQAANLSEVLAWSYSLKSVLRTANIYDVSPDNNVLQYTAISSIPLPAEDTLYHPWLSLNFSICIKKNRLTVDKQSSSDS